MPIATTPPIQGLWLPLVTPFLDGEIDFASVQKLVRHFSHKKIDGFVVAGTTGESMNLSEEETKALVEKVQEANEGNLPVFLGRTGASTRKMEESLAETNKWDIDGYLIAAPHFVKPSQDGMREHFVRLAGETTRPILVYNIPGRTGINVENETLFDLANACPNIVGVKDCTNNFEQTSDLLLRRPPHFSVLVGDDENFLRSTSLGADGGILASAHITPHGFSEVRHNVTRGVQVNASWHWKRFSDLVSLLFKEPNPGPVKYCLYQQGLIASPEMRAPLSPITKRLRVRLDERLAFFYRQNALPALAMA